MSGAAGGGRLSCPLVNCKTSSQDVEVVADKSITCSKLAASLQQLANQLTSTANLEQSSINAVGMCIFVNKTRIFRDSMQKALTEKSNQ
jgi:hypothetical protein